LAADQRQRWPGNGKISCGAIKAPKLVTCAELVLNRGTATRQALPIHGPLVRC
jgi:hypothetical protein